jgi:ribonucleotide monophosphatase NagD (HAD superfamily)
MPSKMPFFVLKDELVLKNVFYRYGLDPKKTLMIGDRLNTDIEFGLNGGIDTLCVLTGNTKSASFFLRVKRCSLLLYRYYYQRRVIIS